MSRQDNSGSFTLALGKFGDSGGSGKNYFINDDERTTTLARDTPSPHNRCVHGLDHRDDEDAMVPSGGCSHF